MYGIKSEILLGLISCVTILLSIAWTLTYFISRELLNAENAKQLVSLRDSNYLNLIVNLK